MRRRDDRSAAAANAVKSATADLAPPTTGGVRSRRRRHRPRRRLRSSIRRALRTDDQVPSPITDLQAAVDDAIAALDRLERAVKPDQARTGCEGRRSSRPGSNHPLERARMPYPGRRCRRGGARRPGGRIARDVAAAVGLPAGEMLRPALDAAADGRSRAAAGGRIESDHRRGDVTIITTPGGNPRKHWSDPVYRRSVIGPWALVHPAGSRARTSPRAQHARRVPPGRTNLGVTGSLSGSTPSPCLMVMAATLSSSARAGAAASASTSPP